MIGLYRGTAHRMHHVPCSHQARGTLLNTLRSVMIYSARRLFRGGAKGGKGGECRGVGEAWSPQFGTCAAPSWPRACARRPLGDRSARPRVACAFGKCHPSSAPNRLDRRFLGTERPAGKTRPGSLPRSGPFPMHCKNLAAEEGLSGRPVALRA